MVQPIRRFTKDPDAVLDYQIDWSRWLDGDTINASNWIVPVGITEDSSSFTDTTATIWLSGGTDGAVYDVVNEMSTVGGRDDNRTIRISVAER